MKITRILLALALVTLFMKGAFAVTGNLPGTDQMSKLTAAGDLIHTVDNFFFKIVARLLAGLTILAAAWNLKEQRFAMAIVCVFGAVMMATVPLWVTNLFAIGGGSGIFN